MKRCAGLAAVLFLTLPALARAGAIEETNVGAMSSAAAPLSEAPLTPASPAPAISDPEAWSALPPRAVEPKAATSAPKPAAAKAAATASAATKRPAAKAAAPAKPAGTKVASSKAPAAKATATKSSATTSQTAKGTHAKAAPAKPAGMKVARATPRPAAGPRRAASDLYGGGGGGRKGRFQVGFIGPGFAAANRGIGPMMVSGIEGEYFFWEHLSAGLRIEVASDFKDVTILSFVPRARYVWDLSGHPRWSLYVQGGVGLALVDARHAAADIAIPGGGFWWQWTDRWSVGADTSLHILVRDDTAVGFTLAPAFRYRF
jgi:hypothetical protein